MIASNTKLLIHADPGARSGFLAAWLTDNLKDAGFDVGVTTHTNFVKIHTLNDVSKIINFSGIKIRIKPSFDKLNLQLLLFLRKNVHVQIPNFTRDEFSLETFSKTYIFSKECFEHDATLNYLHYDHVIDFCDTFNLEKLTELYVKCNNCYPAMDNINHMLKNNAMNQFPIEKNHACNIASMLFTTETKMNLEEKNRLWSLPEIYNTVNINELYDTIQSKIKATNYQTI